MKANSRRRVLISSVAMLLVALVALSTATFAWFTQNTEATASGIYVKTVKASSLVISKDNRVWDTSVTYNQGTNTGSLTMFPASSGNGTAWFTAVSDNATTGAATTITSATTANANAKYVLKQELNVKNDGTEGSIKNIKITINWPTEVAKYARVALVPKADSSSDCVTTAGTFAQCVYGLNGTAYKGLVSTSTTDAVAITPKTATVVEVPELAAQKFACYDLYIWFEGQDALCVDANAGQPLEGLTFTVTGDPA